jgi:hypothetical protein
MGYIPPATKGNLKIGQQFDFIKKTPQNYARFRRKDLWN